MKKKLSELFGRDMYDAGELANTMRALKNDYRETVAALDDTLNSEFRDRPLVEKMTARKELLVSLDDEFSLSAALTLMTDHDIAELVDDMKEGAPRAFPLSSYKPEFL